MHTAGEPFRIVMSGLPIPGTTIIDRRTWLKKNADFIRTALMHEPRGHADMYGGYLTDPTSETADLGVIFVHNEGYSDHCGHGVIALATAAVELGWVEVAEPETRVGIDAPCGFIEAFVQWDGRQAGDVCFVNVPSFIHTKMWPSPLLHMVKSLVTLRMAEHFTSTLMAQNMDWKYESKMSRALWE